MKKLLLAVTVIILTSAITGCSNAHLKANMTQIKEKYSSIESMSGTAIVKCRNSNDTIIFTFVKPDKFLEWYSTKNKMIVYNGSVGLIRDSTGTRKLNEKPFNPYDYGRILMNGKAYVSGNSIVVENDLGKVWLNKNLLPEKIEWNRGITVKIIKLSINGKGDEKIIEDFSGTSSREQKPNKLVSMSEAKREVNFSIISPNYTDGCKFVGAIVSNISGVKVVTLYYGEMNSNKLLTIVEAKNISILDSVCGMKKTYETNINGVNVKVGTALGRWRAYKFKVNGVAVVVYGNIPAQETISVVKSMI
ncbi:MAG: hypothetical protein DSY33_01400 [Archaeoglobus sp.]|nr:MAG: hypothetical protein DSY33_01400 [Archaeoglobus sp.]